MGPTANRAVNVSAARIGRVIRIEWSSTGGSFDPPNVGDSLHDVAMRHPQFVGRTAIPRYGNLTTTDCFGLRRRTSSFTHWGTPQLTGADTEDSFSFPARAHHVAVAEDVVHGVKQ
jgi:hypothetical protein